MAKTTLAVVVNGLIYERYAYRLFETAKQLFKPTEEVEFLTLQGPPGWPDATMRRPQVLDKHMPKDSDYVFLCDADMRFEKFVGQEILPEKGITAVCHPGYINADRSNLPYETRSHSSCFIPPEEGGTYYAGGFYGGTKNQMHNLCLSMTVLIEEDARRGVVPVWHDESALNKVLSQRPPEVALSPSYCYPDNDEWYQTFWGQTYERRLVALDKTQSERGER